MTTVTQRRSAVRRYSYKAYHLALAYATAARWATLDGGIYLHIAAGPRLNLKVAAMTQRGLKVHHGYGAEDFTWNWDRL